MNLDPGSNMGLVPTIKDGDWTSVRQAIQKLARKLGPFSEPTFAGIVLTGSTASRLLSTNASKELASVADLTSWIAGVANEINITDDGDGTITIGIVDPLIVGKGGIGVATLTDHGILLGSGTSAVTPLGVASNGQIPIGSAGVDPVLAEITGTANQVISTPGAGSITLSLPQNIHTGASPTFAGGIFTGVVTGITPTAGVHFATKEYVDLALGAFKTFFLSDTGSGVGSLNYVYPRETGEAESTIVTDPALAEGDNQLIKGFITEAGEPGTTTIHEGVAAFHFHAKKGASNHKTTVLYAILSWVDADGTSSKTPIATSELSPELTDAEAGFDIHITISADIEIASTVRLILDIYANVSSGALNSVVTLYMEGEHDSYFTTKVDSGIWQNYGAVLDDLNTVGQVGADSEFLVGTGAGVFAWESGATARTSIGLGAGDSPTFVGATFSGIVDASSGKVLVEDKATSEPDGESDGYMGVAKISSDGRIYFFVEGQKYYVTGTLVLLPVTGNPIGLLLALTYA